MNSILKSAVLLFSVVFVFYSCSNKEVEGETEINEQKIFATPEEAAAKAKNDLIQVLEKNKDLNLGIDVAKLRNAELAKLVPDIEVNFEKILSTETVMSLSEIASPPKSMIAPFVLENTVVGIAELEEVRKGWKVVGLGNKQITDDLNASGVARNSDAAVTIYEVPNLQIFIYGVKKDTSETYYLNFGSFTLKESAALTTFYPAVRESAVRFQKEFGERLKKEKLVK